MQIEIILTYHLLLVLIKFIYKYNLIFIKIIGSTALHILPEKKNIIITAFPIDKVVKNVINKEEFFSKYFTFFLKRQEYYKTLLESNSYKQN